MLGSLSRRQRAVAITAVLAGLFIAATVVVIWLVLRPEPTYRPGGDVAGLTAELARSVPENYPRVVFRDVTDSAGIAFRHFWKSRSTQLPEDMGSGAAWGDYDNDGWPDLYVVNMAGPLTLTAEQVAASPAHSALYHNNGDGTFSERTREAGLADRVGFWAGASWGDYDRDGFADLYVAGYVRYEDVGDAVSVHYDTEEPASLNPSSFAPELNLLYRNNGDGTFTELGVPAGVAGLPGRSLSAAWADLDGDVWPDLYVANDVSDNALYRNSGDGTFEDVRYGARVADYRGAMGIAVGDWDVDGDPDLFITHWIAQENALYSNMSTQLREAGSESAPLQYIDEADRHGLGQIALDYVGWGTSFVDYDNDGYLDLLVVNGSTIQQRENPQRLIPMPDQLFWNRGPEAGFYDVSSVSGDYFAEQHVGRGAAFADYDRDGDIDVFIVNNGGRGVLLRNDGGNQNRWLQVVAEGRASQRQGLGVKLKLFAGGRVQGHEIGSQSSYLSQNEPVAHFGLGELSRVDSLSVVWPSGERQIFRSVATNRLLRITEGERPN